MLSAAAWAYTAAAGWTTISQARFGVELGTIQAQLRGNGTAGRPQQELGYLWSLPRERAITWHWDPYLCDVLVPGFREDMLGAKLVRCDDLKAAMHRAFTTWSDNHVLLSFADVSAECATLGYERHCPLAGYRGWTGLNRHELEAKSAVVRKELEKYYDELVCATGETGGTGQPFVKKRFCSALKCGLGGQVAGG